MNSFLNYVQNQWKPANPARYERIRKGAYARAALLPPDAYFGVNHLDNVEIMAAMIENAYTHGDKMGWKLDYREDKWGDPKFWEGFTS